MTKCSILVKCAIVVDEQLNVLYVCTFKSNFWYKQVFTKLLVHLKFKKSKAENKNSVLHWKSAVRCVQTCK